METCRIVAIGDEVISGQVADTNSAWLARRVRELGIRSEGTEAVGDRTEAIVGALRRASAAPLVLVTGGLGPTFDDLTRDAAAALAGTPLVRSPEGVAHLESWFRGRGRPMPSSNLRQADLPAGAELLPNAAGTAPGFALDLPSDGTRPGSRLFFLPGVPDEMETMYDREVLPRISRMLPAAAANLAPFKIHLFGIWESEADRRLRETFGAEEMLHLGIRASGGILTVAIYGAPERGPAEVARIRADLPPRLRALFADVAFAEGGEGLPAATVGAFRAAGASLALAESCTGGLAASLLTGVPGASEVFRAGWVVYSNEAKAAHLGVPAALLEEHGAVSEAVARALAEGALERSGADAAVAVTGIAGPSGGTPEKPVGLVWFAAARRGAGTTAASRNFKGPRQRVQLFAAYTALDLARKAILGSPPGAGRGR